MPTGDSTTIDTEPKDPPQGDTDTGAESVDYETKYRDAIAQSRKWEERAKASYKDSQELKALKESQEETAEQAAKLEKKNSELKAQLDSMKAVQQVNEWKQQTAQETGVPADLLRGNTLEELTAHGKALADYAKTLTATQPLTHADTDPQPPAASDIADFARHLFTPKK